MTDTIQFSPIAGRPVMNSASEPDDFRSSIDDFKSSLMEAQTAVATRQNPFMSATLTEDTAAQTPVARLQAGLANEGFRA